MKKRIEFKTNRFGQVFVHIFTCTGKKLVKLAPIALLCVALGACTPQPKTSWEVYCKTYNIDPENPTREDENKYLDCWVGSAEEEEKVEGLYD